jgi:hypothetical protein
MNERIDSRCAAWRRSPGSARLFTQHPYATTSLSPTSTAEERAEVRRRFAARLRAPLRRAPRARHRLCVRPPLGRGARRWSALSRRRAWASTTSVASSDAVEGPPIGNAGRARPHPTPRRRTFRATRRRAPCGRPVEVSRPAGLTVLVAEVEPPHAFEGRLVRRLPIGEPSSHEAQ